jgi:hypothetical protein
LVEAPNARNEGGGVKKAMVMAGTTVTCAVAAICGFVTEVAVTVTDPLGATLGA